LKFLGRAKKFLQDLGTETPSKTQTFNLACASGHRVRGERTEGYQALRCPACGEGVFVLPRSPLPEPAAPAGVPETRGAYGRARSPWVDEGPVELTDPVHGAIERDDGRSGRDGAEIIWDDEPAEAQPRGGASATPQVAPEDLAAAEIDAARRAEEAADRAEGEGRRAVGRGAEIETTRPGRTRADARGAVAPARRESAGAPAPARSVRPQRGRAGAPVADPAPAIIEARPRARRGPRLGLIFFLLTLLIFATIGWRMWRNRRAQYPLIAERGRVEGIPALEGGDFDRAYQLLSAARSAVDALGGAVEDADEIRQAADEAAIYVDLCPESLEDLLAEAGRTNPEAWAAKFDTLYKGRYYLFDSFILSAPQKGGAGAYEIAYVVFPPGEASRFGDGGLARPDRFARVDLAGFELFEQTPPTKAAHVTFGAKLHSVVYDNEHKQWMVHLEPKGGVFITHYGALRAIGWPDPGMVELPQEDQP
jgi:hypothetical protein